MSNFSEPGSTIVPPPPAPEPNTALWEDFVDIFYAPAAVFKRREHANFFVPMLIVTILIGAISLANAGAMQPLMDAEFERGMAKASQNAAMTPEQMAGGRKVAEVLGKIGGFVFPPIGIFLTGLFLWLVGKLVDAKQAFGAALTVTAYSYTVRVVETVVNGAQALLMDPESMNSVLKLKFGPARFLDPDASSPVLLAIVGRMDLFTIWLTILLAIGLSVTGKIPRQQAYIAGAILWVAGALPNVLQALRM